MDQRSGSEGDNPACKGPACKNSLSWIWAPSGTKGDQVCGNLLEADLTRRWVSAPKVTLVDRATDGQEQSPRAEPELVPLITPPTPFRDRSSLRSNLSTLWLSVEIPSPTCHILPSSDYFRGAGPLEGSVPLQIFMLSYLILCSELNFSLLGIFPHLSHLCFQELCKISQVPSGPTRLAGLWVPANK